MDVKEAIEFLRNHFRIGIYEKKSLDIIALLKQLKKKSNSGEKYKKIVTVEFESDNENAIESNINLLKAHLERVRDIPPQIKYTIKKGER